MPGSLPIILTKDGIPSGIRQRNIPTKILRALVEEPREAVASA